MRFKKSFKNLITGFSFMLLNGILSFVKIAIIVRILGNEINGVNNVIGQIFNFLMIGEAGLSLATITLLYKPIADGDKNKINTTISGSFRIISIIIMLIFLLALVLSLLVPFLIKDTSLAYGYLSLVFILFASKTLIPQFSQPIKAYAIASQEEYVINYIKIINILLLNLIEIIIILSTKNYLYMLMGGLISTIILELLVFKIIFIRYPFLKINNKIRDYSALTHMKELVKVNVVGTVAKSIDPIIVSRIIGIITASFYSNYAYVQYFLQSILGAVLGSVTHMFGDMFVKKEEGLYQKFNMYIAISNFIASTAAVCFYAFIQQFITLWIGSDALFNQDVVLLFSVLIYMYTAIRPINTLIITNGFFKLSSKSAIYEAIINGVLSITLSFKFGVSGVLIGSIVSYLVASFWLFPVKTYFKVFGVSSKEYFKRQLISIVTLFLLYEILYFIQSSSIFVVNSFLELFLLVITISILVFIVNLLIYIIFIRDFRLFVSYLRLKFTN